MVAKIQKQLYSIHNRIGVSHKNPFAPSLDKFVEKEPYVREDEAADVETEEFGGVARA